MSVEELSKPKRHTAGGRALAAWKAAALAVALAGCATAAPEERPLSSGLTFVTLGTGAGPVARAERAQPANLLVQGGRRWLVDTGDGAASQLGALGVQPAQIDGVFLSHLHQDHIGGLQAVIGLRWMTQAASPLAIHGPKGTRELVDGIVASMTPSSRIGFGFGRPTQPPAESVTVTELADGDVIEASGLRVSVASNSHFSGKPADGGEPVSLSFRFEAEGRSIGYTGDTGPSPAVAALFRGVDLMVSEVIDVPHALGEVTAKMPQLQGEQLDQMRRHLASHHLTPADAGAMAQAAGAKRLVFTHVSAAFTAEAEAALVAQAGAAFSGPVDVARDLDRF